MDDDVYRVEQGDGMFAVDISSQVKRHQAAISSNKDLSSSCKDLYDNTSIDLVILQLRNAY